MIWTLRSTGAISASVCFLALCTGAVNAAHPGSRRSVHKSGFSSRSTAHSSSKPRAATHPQKTAAAPAKTLPNPAGAIDRATHDRGLFPSAHTLPIVTRGESIARTALAYRGVAYRYGGRSAQSGFDCSGLVQTVCAKWGFYLPRVAGAQFARGVAVKPWQLKPGDLVFFQGTYKHGLSHVGIFIGEGQFVHAAGRGQGVRISKLSDGYFQHHWAGARRLDLSKLPRVPDELPVIASEVIVDGSARITDTAAGPDSDRVRHGAVVSSVAPLQLPAPAAPVERPVGPARNGEDAERLGGPKPR